MHTRIKSYSVEILVEWLTTVISFTWSSTVHHSELCPGEISDMIHSQCVSDGRSVLRVDIPHILTEN